MNHDPPHFYLFPSSVITIIKTLVYLILDFIQIQFICYIFSYTYTKVLFFKNNSKFCTYMTKVTYATWSVYFIGKVFFLLQLMLACSNFFFPLRLSCKSGKTSQESAYKYQGNLDRFSFYIKIWNNSIIKTKLFRMLYGIYFLKVL